MSEEDVCKKDRKVMARKVKRKVLIPFEDERFWIEVAWIDGTEENIEEEEWIPSPKKGKKLSDNIEWWPALVELENREANLYMLFYSASPASSSQKDLNFSDKHWICFEDSEWIVHVDGSEKGKRCTWRHALWERASDKETDTASIGGKLFHADVQELRGCYLELMEQTRNEKKRRVELSDRIARVERFADTIEKNCITKRIRMYTASSLISLLTFEGRDNRLNSNVSAFSNCYRQVVARTRSVDCTLLEYRELAREVDERVGIRVQLKPGRFPVMGFGMRHKNKMSLTFDSFHTMCFALQLNISCFSDLVFQGKTDVDGSVSVFQIVGQVIERSQKRFGKVPLDHVPECVMLPGGCFQTLRHYGEKSIFVISRKESKWHEQSSTCDEQFLFESKSASSVIDALADGLNTNDEQSLWSYKLEWESLKGDKSLVPAGQMHGENGVLGRLWITVPLIQVRTIRAVREIEQILGSNGEVLKMEPCFGL